MSASEGRMKELQQRLDAIRIRHFTANELTYHRRWNMHQTPPDEILYRIMPTVKLADSIRHGLGAPIRVASGYRTEDYNELVGGSPMSEHVNFRAMDIQSEDPDRLEEMRAIAIAVVDHARRMGRNVALIHYDTFIHIDVGSKRRRNLDLDNR